MKTLHLAAIAALACALSAATLNAGTGTRYTRDSSGPSRLVIYRAANFGTFTSVNVYIDGVLAGNIPFNTKYDAFVPAGHHVVALEQLPRRGAAFVTSEQRIRLTPGGTSVYTVMTTDGGSKAVLEGS